jgi:predicted SprT family Zn-dependent metalloprotease
MNGLTSDTGRFAPAKIEVKCRCGKRYRVPSSKAGKRLRCKKCRSAIKVPGSMKISMRSRQAILQELGIDAQAAEQNYQQKKKDSSYACSVCAETIPKAKLKGSYGESGLTCAPCRLGQKKTEKEETKKREEAKLDDWTRGRSTPEAALRKSAAMGLLFGVGTAGILHTFFGPPAWVMGAVALTVAAIGGRTSYKHETR